MQSGYSAYCSIWALRLALVSLAGCMGSHQSQLAPEAAPSADHYILLQTPELMRATDAALRRIGLTPADAPPIVSATADQAVEALDFAGVRYGLALSGGYSWGSRERSSVSVPSGDSVGVQSLDEGKRVRAENLFVAEQVARFPDRLKGACSANPLADYALEEVRHCGADARIAAFRLHLPGSGVDLTDRAHVARLRAVFEALEETGLVAVVTLRYRGEGYGAEDAEVFIQDVLAAAPRVPVQIAHMAGWGRYDAETDSAMWAFVDAFESGTLDPDRFTFDLATVVRDDPREAGADPERARQFAEWNARLAVRIRQVGLERVVFGSDWPLFPPVGEPRARIALYREWLEERLPLKPQELDRIFANLGPVLLR
jgi:predicted TIM-barrel fold metal-dependent hydrolase